MEQNDLGTSLGRVHMERQDFQKLQTRKMKGLKSKKGQAVTDNAVGIAEEKMDAEES